MGKTAGEGLEQWVTKRPSKKKKKAQVEVVEKGKGKEKVSRAERTER